MPTPLTTLKCSISSYVKTYLSIITRRTRFLAGLERPIAALRRRTDLDTATMFRLPCTKYWWDLVVWDWSTSSMPHSICLA